MMAIKLDGSKRWEANLRLPLIGQKLRKHPLAVLKQQAPRNVAQVTSAAARIRHRDRGIIVAGHFENKCTAKSNLD
jgi:hypothetical protein